MNLLLNIALLSLFIWWFWKHFVIQRKIILIGIVGLFLLASILVFIFSLYVQNDYLDGLHYLVVGALSISIFWLGTTTCVIWKNIKEKTTKRIFLDLLQLILLILIPLLIWVILSNSTFKIGG